MKSPNGNIKDYIHVVTDNDILAAQIMDSLSGDFCYIRSRSVADALSNMTYQTPSLIITERSLSDMSAYDFVKKIRNSIKTKLIPFVVISETDDVEQRILAIECGVDAFIKYPFMPEELNVLVNSKLNKFKEFYLLSITDELTRLYNRKEFMRKFNDLIMEENHGVISLAILDIDHFKRVNDIYGHQIGDMVLMKIADMLKERTDANFFPARFGGEEFVILFPGFNSAETMNVVKDFLNDFSSIIFDTPKAGFSVTFSAGVAEYPDMASNISELLTRADQALYTAKYEGRNRVYLFSPIMARNDKFWDHLNIKKSVFVNDYGNDSVTDLPYLPHALESIMNVDFEVSSIGVLILKPRHLVDIQDEIGLVNHYYDVENIKNFVKKSCEMIFPSDTYIALSELYETEFAIFFPSVVDFSFNIEKFNSICKDIVIHISDKLSDCGVDLLYASDVTCLDRSNPKNIIRILASIRKKLTRISDFKDRFNGFTSAFSSAFLSGSMFDELCAMKPVRHTGTLEQAFIKVAFISPFDGLNLLKNFIEKLSEENIEKFAAGVLEKQKDNHNLPILLPWIGGTESNEFMKILFRAFKDVRVIFMINEIELDNAGESFRSSIRELPDNFSMGIRNAYAGSNILKHLSEYNFSLFVFSRNMIRNLHVFRDRIQIINGLKIFADQIKLPVGTMGVTCEEEFQVVKDLGLSYVAGDYVEKMISNKGLSS